MNEARRGMLLGGLCGIANWITAKLIAKGDGRDAKPEFSFGPGALIDGFRARNAKIIIGRGDVFRNCVFENCDVEVHGGRVEETCAMNGGTLTIHDGSIGTSGGR